MVTLHNWWRVTGTKIIIPAGGIIGLNTLAVPTGYTAYTAADDSYIIGAGGDLAVLASADPEAAFDLTTDGSHATGTKRYYLGNRTNGGGKNKSTHYDGARGAHTHASTLKHNPNASNMKLIQAIGDAGIPTGGVLFSDDEIDGLSLATEFNDLGGFMRAESVLAPGFETRADIADVVSSTMGHSHNWFCNNGCSDGYSNTTGGYGTNGTSFSHVHAGIAITSGIIKQVALKAFKAIEDLEGVKGSIIILYPSDTLPAGWSICDGTGGTPDCRDRFLNPSSTGTGAGTGDNSLAAAGTTDTFGHHHTINSTNVAADAMFHSSVVSHSHAFSWAGTLTPKHFALNFIKYTG